MKSSSTHHPVAGRDGRRTDPATLRASGTSVRVDGAVGLRGRSRRIRLGVVALMLSVAGSMVMMAEASDAQTSANEPDAFFTLRQDMVENQIRRRGITERDMLSAMEEVPRHRFVPESLGPSAYKDAPVSFAPGQNLSQAYVSARMISLLNLDSDDTVLEIGTGSGYDAAVLSRLAKTVYTVEIDRELGEKARRKLDELGYENVQVRVGDGYRGWPEAAPFDGILLTAAAQRVPEPLFQQLKIGGRMVIAVGYQLHQDLKVITRTGERSREVKRVSLISLTPMTGEVTLDPDE